MKIRAMYRYACAVVLGLALLSFGAQGTSADEVPDWVKTLKIHGLAFGDTYWAAAHHDSIEGMTGAWMRRIYLTFDKHLSDELSARIRFESNSPGDFKSSSKMTPTVKDAYIRWKHSGRSFYIGLASTPTWGRVEKHWGYRAVEKSPLDLQKFGSSREFGFSYKGSTNTSMKIDYHAMIGNGSGNKGETNKGKKAMGALAAHLTDEIVFELYSDFEERPGDMNRTLSQAFLGINGSWGRAGGLVARQWREQGEAATLKMDIASVYVVIDISERINGLVRFDHTDANADAAKIAYLQLDPTAATNLFLAGIDIQVSEGFNIIPNIEIIAYDDPKGGGTSPSTDVFARTTFSLVF